ncbi:prion-inhibition and propagation-domain-containing protein [Neurospora hispaniola]|uniref:Prion-inhibition and propagation-domain-containing protein n=1 Tax=Neurospora hispaniola TaxID=588809 RepID=A0AAJ0I6D9_9PEZI|nr:prion-inhibition and propagation-domain-containing protein [Neurospora hispaniola]
MEPVGLAIGVIGLAGVLKSCVELFGYFSTYHSYGHDYNLLDAKLHVEKAVLLQWADRVRLLHEDYDRRLDNPTIREAVSHILSSITHLLSETSSLQQRYGVEQRDGPHSQLLVSQSSAIVSSLMEKFKNDYNTMQLRIHHRKATTPASDKLRWMIVDKDKFNTLIAELSHFTSKLDALLPGDSSERTVSLLASLIRNEVLSVYKENAKLLPQQAADGRLEGNDILQEARDQDRALKSLWFRCMDDRKDSVSPAHVKTLQWALKPACEREGCEAEWDDLSEWLRSGTGVYWICGKAGSGKSTLMKYLHDNPDTRAPLQAWAGDLPLTFGSFFFWGLGTQGQKSLEGLSRAILYRLLEAESSYLPSALPRLWQEVRVNVHKEPDPPSSGELRAASEFMTKRFQPKRRFCLFIDGLDEFQGNFHDAIKLIRGLCSNPAIKVIVSSRPIAICYDAFSRVPQLHMESLTRNDIKEYIYDVIGSHDYMKILAGSGVQSPNILTNKLIEKASGVFLWVILACRSILDGFAAYDTIAELCRRVDDLPPELEDLFVHMLNSVDPHYHEQMAKTLKILYARKASNDHLATIELAFFDRNDMDCVSNNPLETITVHEAHKICSTMMARLRSRCGGLLQAEPRLGFAIKSRSDADSNLDICWCPSRETCPWIRRISQNSPLQTHKSGGFPEHSKIEFIHRAVFEFLDNPKVWDLAPLRISDPTFSVACALAGMTLQLSYLHCQNGARLGGSFKELLAIDHEPLESVLPVLAKLADCLSLTIPREHYATNEAALQSCFSRFLDPAYNRSSLQLSLPLAVEAGLVNTVGRLLQAVRLRPPSAPFSPFPLLYHALILPFLYDYDHLGPVISRPLHELLEYLLSQDFSPNEVFVNERGLSTTPWRELVLKGQRQFEGLNTLRSFFMALNTFKLMKPLIEHGAELDNVLPGIPTMEKFLDDVHARLSLVARETIRFQWQSKETRDIWNSLMAAIANRRRVMAAEALASSTASEQNKETVTQLDDNLGAQIEEKVDSNSNSNKVDTGSSPKLDTDRKVHLKAVQAPLWWLLLFAILALSIHMKPGLLSQAGP